MAGIAICWRCHTDDVEVLRMDVHGLIVLCNECGFARPEPSEQLLAS
jgi:uncharacterized Zn finger protein